VTILYTAPTAIRTFMKWGTEFSDGHDLSSLRLLGTVGEPINPEAWIWYWTHIGGERCPVVDTWWQTETGAIMISPLPGATTLKPGSATFPLPGIGADVVDERDMRTACAQQRDGRWELVQRIDLVLRPELILAGVDQRAQAALLDLPPADRQRRDTHRRARPCGRHLEHVLEPVRAGHAGGDRDQRFELTRGMTDHLLVIGVEARRDERRYDA